jgi:dipeptidyl aminopeptidase/acylaminoacyl peptidase
MTSGYKMPPEAMRRILDTAPTPQVSLSTDGRTLVLMDRVSLPPVADLSAPMLRLGGSRVNPLTSGPHGPRRVTGFVLRDVSTGAERRVAVRDGANLSGPGWTSDGSRFLFTDTREDGIDLYVCDVASGVARRVELGAGLHAAAGMSARWMPDQRHVLVRVVPTGRGAMPERPRTPTGPIVQDSRGAAAPVRTFQDLLTDAHDEAVFEWMMASQLAIVDVGGDAWTVRTLGAPAIFAESVPSPDGRYVLVSRVVRPYSYLVPWSLFPEVVEVWDAGTGEVVREIGRLSLRDTIPTQGVETGPRGHEWVEASGATLTWAEALDGGDPLAKVSHRDRVMTLAAPFDGEARELLRTEHRYRGMAWLEAEEGAGAGGKAGGTRRAMVSEFERERRRTRTWLVEAKEEGGAGGWTRVGEPRLVFDRSINDRYNDPGAPVSDIAANGSAFVLVRDGMVLLRGEGATPEGNRPFLDAMSLADFSTKRLWRNAGDEYERVVDVMDAGRGANGELRLRVVTSHETVTSPPNMRERVLSVGDGGGAGGGAGVESSAVRAVTAFTDPLPELRSIEKRVMRYARADGVPLSATLYTPPGYDAARDGRLPLLIWAYPNEVSDAATAGQVSDSPHRFTQIGGSSHLFVLLAGYAVMDDASMPIVGDPETVNDTFVDQIVTSAQAAIDAARDAGVGDPTRVAVAGHSYGAFMTANLLAHAPKGMFRAGIARSGAYNRTLTPFGFQSERRSFWDARDVYMRLSPFTYADRITTPLLLIHGQIDNNPGTFPMQSERLFQAMNGRGLTARLVMLPHEGHGYVARESVQHVLAEMVEWMDRYVKPLEPASGEAGGAGESGGAGAKGSERGG